MKKQQNNKTYKYRIYGVIGMLCIFLMGGAIGVFVGGLSIFNKSVKYQPAQENIVREIPKSTCQKIEEVLLRQLDCVNDDCYDAEDYIEDAQIYANLADRGCAENSENYKNLAKQNLEIARALNDDKMNFSDEKEETIEIVETYKRLQMQAEAERMIEKAKKLTNPAIDFIIELEKIIEE